MKSAKERFKSIQQAPEFDRLINSIPFELGADAAMVEFMQRIPPDGTGGVYARGATDFLKILTNLTNYKEPALPKDPSALDYNATKK